MYIADATVCRTTLGLVSNKFIAHAVYRLDVLWVPGIVLELLTQPRYVNVDRARGRHRVIAPDSVKQVITRMYGAAVLDKKLQEPEFHRGEINRVVVARHLCPFEVNPYIAKAECAVGDRFALLWGSAEQRLDAC